MFPGLGASVFDEKKSKEEKLVQQEEYEWLKAQRKRLENVMSTYSKARRRVMKHLDDEDAFIHIGNGLGPNDVRYDSFGWLDKYTEVSDTMMGYAIGKNSSIFNNIEKVISDYNRIEKQWTDIRRKVNTVRNKIEIIEKSEKKARVSAASVSFDSYAQATQKISAPSPIPNKIPVAGAKRRPINNPYVTVGAAKQYAGHVAHYPHWSRYWKDQITTVEGILKRNGKGGLEMMYASTHQHGGGRFNFVITGANGKLTWRKYDPSPGAGQNWIFLDGKKMNTSSLLSANQKQQDQMVQAL